MAWRPKFDTIYQGEWPHRGDEGVGIRMDGMPYSDREFLSIMEKYNCPHPFALHALRSLNTDDTLTATVAHNLDFDQLSIDLLELGVTLTIVPPRSGWKLKS